MKQIRIVLADDHTMFRDGLRMILRDVEDIEIVGEASDGAEVLALVDELKPDVVVMDVHMKKLDGVQTTRLLMERSSPPAVIMLTMYDQDDYLFEAIRVGVRGYYLKESDAETLIAGIRNAAAGELMLDPALAHRVIQKFQQSAYPLLSQGRAALSERETQILRLVAGGASNACIAESVNLSVKTIKNQLVGVFRKLNLENRTQAALYALRHELVTLEELEI